MKLNKQIIIGIIIGGTLFSSLDIFAGTTKFLLEKVNYKIVVNGKSFELDNILSLNGTTYIPLREVSGLLKYKPSFKKDTITLTEINPTHAMAESPSIVTTENNHIESHPVPMHQDKVYTEIPQNKNINEYDEITNKIPVSYKSEVIRDIKDFTIDYTHQIEGCVAIPINTCSKLLYAGGRLSYYNKDRKTLIQFNMDDLESGIRTIEVYDGITHKIKEYVKCGKINGFLFLDSNIVQSILKD